MLLLFFCCLSACVAVRVESVKLFHVERHRPSMWLISRLESAFEPSKVQYIEVLSRFRHAQPRWDPGSRNPLSHKTPCHPSPQKHIGTPAQLRDPARTPVLNSHPVTRSRRKTPEGSKREEGCENAVICLWGSRATGAPLSPEVEPPVQSGSRHVIRVARCPADIRASDGAPTGAAYCDNPDIEVLGP